MKRLLILVFVLLLSGALPAQAQSTLRVSPFYAELERRAQKDGSTAVADAIKENGNSKANLDIIMQWLRDRSWMRLDPDPYYLLYYSDLTYKIAKENTPVADQKRGLYESSFQALNMFEAVALADAARCEDPTAIQPLIIVIADRYKSFGEVETRQNVQSKKNAQAMALDREQRMVERKPLARICYGGKKAKTEGDSFTPRFLDRRNWDKKRAEIREMIKNR